MRDAVESWFVAATRRTRALRADIPVVCVGGSVLGGTGKTPLAIAIARFVASRGLSVALVGHAYRARPECARVVQPDDDVRVVGDEGLVCARALDAVAPVVVAPSRQAAMDCAAKLASVLVLDGVLQLRERAALAILTVPEGCSRATSDADRAPPRALRDVADVVARVRTTMTCTVAWEQLRRERVGVITCLARPKRVLRALAARRVLPWLHVGLPDHGPRTRGQLERETTHAGVDRWLATNKCAQHLAGLPRLATLACEAVLGPSLEMRIAAALALDRPLRAPYSPSSAAFFAVPA